MNVVDIKAGAFLNSGRGPAGDLPEPGQAGADAGVGFEALAIGFHWADEMRLI